MLGYSHLCSSLQRYRLLASILRPSPGFSISGYRPDWISIRACHHIRDLPLIVDSTARTDRDYQATGTSRFRISERVVCKDIQNNRKLQFFPSRRLDKDFYSFIESTPRIEVVAFFREIAEELQTRRQLENFRMVIRNGDCQFKVEVRYGNERDGPEVSAPWDCISCFADAPIFPGREPRVESRECILEEFSDQSHVRCRLDAKARPGIAIAPVRHVERMPDLKDAELYTLWSMAVRLLRQEEMPFVSMVLHHGTYRYRHHLHLKVWVGIDAFARYQLKWSEERKEVWKRLNELEGSRHAKARVCSYHKVGSGCSLGDLCSFSHA